MPTQICSLAFAMLLLFVADGQCHPAVDFRNFEYPCPEFASRSELTWMPVETKCRIRLSDGVYTYAAHGPMVALGMVSYGSPTGERAPGAIVVLNFDSGGTSHWSVCYVYEFDSSGPTLKAWFQAGDRARFGLIDIGAQVNGFVVSLRDPKQMTADCCSGGYYSFLYRWSGNRFNIAEPPKRYTVRRIVPDKAAIR